MIYAQACDHYNSFFTSFFGSLKNPIQLIAFAVSKDGKKAHKTCVSKDSKERLFFLGSE